MLIFNFIKICPKCGSIMIDSGIKLYCPSCGHFIKIY